MIRLSICIPTYNFGHLIGQTLDSILPQLTDEVEVVILDGGSNDNTTAVVKQRMCANRQITYYQQGCRGGIDRDISKVVSLSTGEYCWLFSADDIMKSDSVAKVLNVIATGKDIYLCEHTLCTFDMVALEEYRIFNTLQTPKLFDFSILNDYRTYFEEARTSEAFFSFLSGPIFKRSRWNQADGIPDSFNSTCWALAGRLLSLLPKGLTVQYTAENLLYKRGDNDSFLDKGVVHRLSISVDGFAHIADTLFGKESFETYHIRRVIRNERTFLLLLLLKSQVYKNRTVENIDEMYEIVQRHYAGIGMINLLKYLVFRIIPVPVINLAAAFRKQMIGLLSARKNS